MLGFDHKVADITTFHLIYVSHLSIISANNEHENPDVYGIREKITAVVLVLLKLRFFDFAQRQALSKTYCPFCCRTSGGASAI